MTPTCYLEGPVKAKAGDLSPRGPSLSIDTWGLRALGVGLSAPCEVVSSTPGLSHGNVRAPRTARGAVQHVAGRRGGAQDSLACIFHGTRGLVQGGREKGTITMQGWCSGHPCPCFNARSVLGTAGVFHSPPCLH